MTAPFFDKKLGPVSAPAPEVKPVEIDFLTTGLFCCTSYVFLRYLKLHNHFKQSCSHEHHTKV